jgi:hypothetical protein
MLMGRIVSKKKYEFYEYTVAVLISLGMACFFMGKEQSRESSTVTTLSGILIMVGYMAFDSFTSIWQGQLFKVGFSVADSGCSSRIPDPDFYPFRIQKQQQKRGVQKISCQTFFCSHKFHKIENYSIF